MESFWEVARLALLAGAGVLVLVLILLALPNSGLRRVFSAIFFTIAGLLGVYIVSPIDALPDFIPLLGQLDALLATVLAIVNGISGIVLYLNSRASPRELEDGRKKSPSSRR